MEEILQTNPDTEIVCSRVLNAPRELVFRAWSQPEHLKNWWGTMHGPEKGNYENACEFIKIDPPALIAWQRHSKPIFQVLATFEEVSPDKTLNVFKQLFHTAEECAKLKKYVLDKNEENFDRLERELERMSSQTQ